MDFVIVTPGVTLDLKLIGEMITLSWVSLGLSCLLQPAQEPLCFTRVLISPYTLIEHPPHARRHRGGQTDYVFVIAD